MIRFWMYIGRDYGVMTMLLDPFVCFCIVTSLCNVPSNYGFMGFTVIMEMQICPYFKLLECLK